MKKKVTAILFALALCIGTIFPLCNNIQAASKATIYLCGIIDEDGADRTTWQTQAANYLSVLPNADIIKSTAFTADQLSSYVRKANVLVINSHGNEKVIRAVDSSGKKSWLTYGTMSGWSSDALKELEIVFLGTCDAGLGGETADNMVNIFYNKGAQCVIGYYSEAKAKAVGIMLREFCTALGQFYMVKDALAYADACVLAEYGTAGGTNYRLVRGNTNNSLIYYTDIVAGTSEQLECKNRIVTEDHLSTSDADNLIYFSDTDGIYGYFNWDNVVNTMNREHSIYNIESHVSSSMFSNHLDLDEYTLIESIMYEDTGLTGFVYDYVIDGVNTDDYIFIILNSEGNIVSMGHRNEGRFAEVDLSKIDFNRANSELVGVLSANNITNYTIVDERLVYMDGLLSMRYSVQYEEEESSVIDDFIVVLQ